MSFKRLLIVKTSITDHEGILRRHLGIVKRLAIAISIRERARICCILEGGLTRRIQAGNVPLAIAEHKIDRALLFDIKPFLGEAGLYKIQ